MTIRKSKLERYTHLLFFKRFFKAKDIAICIDQLRSDLLRILNTVKRALPWLLAVYLLHVIVMSTGSLLVNVVQVVGVTRELKSLDSAVVYLELIHFLILANWVAFITLPLALFVWAILSFCAWAPLDMIIKIGYRLLFPDHSKWWYEDMRYRWIVERWVRGRLKRVNCVLLPSLFILLVVMLPQRLDSPKKIIGLFINIVVVLVPIVFVIVWVFYLMVRHHRRNKWRFDYYYFSKQAIKAKLASIISFLVFLAVLGNVFIPWLFIGIGGAINAGPKIMLEKLEFKSKYQLLEQEGYTSSKEQGMAALPPPNELKNYARYLFDFGDDVKPKILLEQFQQGMFFVVTLAGFFFVAIPACGNAIIYRKRRDALKKILFSVISSMVIIAILNMFIKKAYFIDTSKVMGTATLFLFIISLSLCHISVDPLKSEL